MTQESVLAMLLAIWRQHGPRDCEIAEIPAVAAAVLTVCQVQHQDHDEAWPMLAAGVAHGDANSCRALAEHISTGAMSGFDPHRDDGKTRPLLLIPMESDLIGSCLWLAVAHGDLPAKVPLAARLALLARIGGKAADGANRALLETLAPWHGHADIGRIASDVGLAVPRSHP